jgi:hypothetical protein
VDAGGEGGGTVRIWGGQFVVENRFGVSGNNIGPITVSGGIDVEAEAVTLTTRSAMATFVLGAGLAAR